MTNTRTRASGSLCFGDFGPGRVAGAVCISRSNHHTPSLKPSIPAAASKWCHGPTTSLDLASGETPLSAS
eukprot:CAMPEP_0175809582 /NCGR_PEP_ID=MMETSP0107_2-20121207/2871_1 /TAXON_ID=195067 ORGANISM="Goniomonas pacifica, Strain CCMP1869" /NCGR_SAMPLE_ID=MMETSP0107_2 /ASSEMBLY_ACC=CAM_ASM_000203 /LENGTH=69 /DNA_ID=CAMNT_0017121289 /DNA_START=831 /DNA_END=1036 /DNA_ORIENTATION=+